MGFPVPDYDTLAGEISAPAYNPIAQRRIATRAAATHVAAQHPLFHGRRPLSLEDLAIQAQNAVETLLARASASLRERLSEGGRLSAAKIEREQHAAHGLAWLATYVEAIKQLGGYARRMSAEGRLSETEELLTCIGLGRLELGCIGLPAHHVQAAARAGERAVQSQVEGPVAGEHVLLAVAHDEVAITLDGHVG